ncbi:MAG: hypothetical protein K9N11_01555 [Lentisphaeria bacterium]|nr:hypothetical protein [Candidatus Neomarinimicrobiota bacterium]MCF7841514.1 hypothetical protein [Lentisphaeria bacterium]
MSRSVSRLFGLILLFGVTILHADIRLGGYLRPYTAVNLNSPNNYMIMEEKARLKTTLSGFDARGVFVLDARHDHLTGRSNWDFNEAYVDLFFDKADVRIGKQQVVWGKADGIPINDIVCPWDLQDFILQDFDDIRIGLNMIKTNVYLPIVNLEALWIPQFQPMQLAQTGPWVFQLPTTATMPVYMGLDTTTMPPQPIVGMQTFKMGYAYGEYPGNNLGNSEFGFRLYGFNWGFDWALNYLNGWDDTPALEQQKLVTTDSLLNLQTYYRTQMLGLNFSRPVLSGVLRAEGGYYLGKRFNQVSERTPSLTNPMVLELVPIEKPYLQYMVGWDQNWRTWLNLSGQYIEQRILDYEETLQNEEVNRMISLLLRGSFMNETLSYQVLALANLAYEDALVRSMVTYDFADGLRLILGLDVLKSGKTSTSFRQFDFGRFDQNDNVYLKAQYSF